MHYTIVFALCYFVFGATGFVFSRQSTRRLEVLLFHSPESKITAPSKKLDPVVAEKFKVTTCMSTSCSRRRKELGLEPLSTFAAFYSRAKDGGAPSVRVEEGPCVGSCKNAPCEFDPIGLPETLSIFLSSTPPDSHTLFVCRCRHRAR